MTEPRRVRTQAERDADGQAWRAGDDWRRDLIGVRTADGRLYAPEDVELMYPNPPSTDPDIWVRMENVSPSRRRWWHRLTRRNP